MVRVERIESLGFGFVIVCFEVASLRLPFFSVGDMAFRCASLCACIVVEGGHVQPMVLMNGFLCCQNKTWEVRMILDNREQTFDVRQTLGKTRCERHRLAISEPKMKSQ